MLDVLKSLIRRYFSDPQFVMLVLLIVASFALIFSLGSLLTPAFISVIIAYLLEGAVSRLEKTRLPRLAGVILVFSGFMACLLVLLVWLLPLLSRQIAELLQNLPSMISRARTELLLLPERYPEFISSAQINQILDYLTAELTRLTQYILTVSLASVKGFITLLVYCILVPLMVFFFLKDKTVILNWIAGLLPDERKLAGEVWREVNVQIANYIRGKLWETLVVWGVTYVTFVFMGLPFSMLLSLFVGLSVLIPYVGATIMFFPVGLIAFMEWGWGSQFLSIMIALGIIQALDGNILVPLLFSDAVNIHPVAIILAVMLFGGLWGIWGLFLAIPLATLVHAVINVWLTSRRVGEAAGEAPPA